MNRPFAGRYRPKIHARQQISAETQAHLERLDQTRIGLGPGEPALSEWRARGLELPDLDAMRRYRLERVREQLRRLDYAGILLYDPINIRYATDSSNMQIWTMHNAVRYCFIATDGPVVLFDFKRCEHLSAHLPLIDEVRTALSWIYFYAGDHVEEAATRWAEEIVDLVVRYGGDNRRLAVDQVGPEGLRALERLGVSVHNGQEVMELARLIKCPDEIRAMRCAIAACEEALRIMQAELRPGMTEQELWAILHAENIKRGGEWLETRLLASGPRTNPWYQECSSRVIQEGDLVAFDTDLIGAYGICVDISRTWLCGDVRPNEEQRRCYQMAYEQIQVNGALPRPGVGFREAAEKARSLPEDYLPNRYTCMYHGVGLADEYPSIAYLEDWSELGTDGVFQPNMVVCVESYVGRVGGREGVKLEEQLLVTETGVEPLSTYPYEPELLR